ncbi:hypothetical protein [Mycobacterium avium]|uniref:ORC-CDC6 family AAA ATPase n=1 Tax=Mycobacterium avium TaxID=1764 RepID=UPI0013C490D9|nr:hypothetical protein [Mycobacterium avium]
MTAQLRDTFVDSGVAAALESIDHQVLYGRRGTGKTHALQYLASTRTDDGDIGIYIDLRVIGSAQGLFDSERASPLERTGRLLVNLLTEIHDAILDAVLSDEELIADESIALRLDYLLDSLKNTVAVDGRVETTVESDRTRARRGSLKGKVSLTSMTAGAEIGGEASGSDSDKRSETRKGQERLSLNFGEIARSLRELAQSLKARRVWLLLDEWSSVPLDMQPYLGEFLVRCVTPVQAFTVKIAAIEQQTRFRATIGDGPPIGIELGADFAANVDLDDFMVFEQDRERARDFFRGLFFKHLTAGADEDEQVPGLRSERDLMSMGFTSSRVFDELVRGSEGVPRDAINIAAKAAVRAGDRPDLDARGSPSSTPVVPDGQRIGAARSAGRTGATELGYRQGHPRKASTGIPCKSTIFGRAVAYSVVRCPSHPPRSPRLLGSRPDFYQASAHVGCGCLRGFRRGRVVAVQQRSGCACRLG